MNLWLFPAAEPPCPFDGRALLPGKVHDRRQRCPFFQARPASGQPDCCAFDASALVRVLDALAPRLSASVRKDMTKKSVRAFFVRLFPVRRRVEALQRREARRKQAEARGREAPGRRTGLAGRDGGPSPEEALTALRDGIFWFGVLAAEGFGASACPAEDRKP
jgi:hypothetical protein